MRPAKKRIQAPAPFHEEDLLRLELQVAKRADKLWRRAGCRSGRDLIHWLQAESEVLGRHFGFERLAAAALAEDRLDSRRLWVLT